MNASGQAGKAAKKRLDAILVERGMAESRAKAVALILAGAVYGGERRLDKPGHMLAADADISVRGKPHPWVGRGGVKLAHALDRFAIDPKGKICLDIGASTGGFTDVLLARGAIRVHAVDVGQGQLDWRLRQDPRVSVHEGVNARYLTREMVGELADIIVCDASFIGLEKILPAPLSLARPGAVLIALIKPQFELDRRRVGKGGIVRNASLHDEVCARIKTWLGLQPGWTVLGMGESPIQGADGNREFFIAARHA